MNYLKSFSEIWKYKTESVQIQRGPNKIIFSEEAKSLEQLVKEPGKGGKNGVSSIDSELSLLRKELVVNHFERVKILSGIVENIADNMEVCSSEFLQGKINEPCSRDLLYTNKCNIDSKKTFLENQIKKLERIQIAESIVGVKKIDNSFEKFKITFDNSLLEIEMVYSKKELLEVNKLREFSLFGIHKSGPSNDHPYFSYFSDLDNYCKTKEYVHSPANSYNKDVAFMQGTISQMRDKLGKKSSTKKDARLVMCHHCKAMLPESSLVKCQRPCKNLSTEPCKSLSKLQGIS
jgi:hypothetical protein